MFPQAEPVRGLGRKWDPQSDPTRQLREEVADKGKSAPLRVLLVEDEYFIALEIEHWLSDAGYQVVASVSHAEAAIEAARTEKPDLVIMDIRLSGEPDGIFAAEKIHREFGIRSLFSSAHLDKEAEARAAGARPLGWLPKPFGRRDFLAAIAEAVDRLKDGR